MDPGSRLVDQKKKKEKKKTASNLWSTNIFSPSSFRVTICRAHTYKIWLSPSLSQPAMIAVFLCL